jgi:hypothetical protein
VLKGYSEKLSIGSLPPLTGSINSSLILHPIFLQEAEEKQEDETASSNTSKSGKKQNARPVDLDPHGEKLVQVFIFATGLI